MARHGIALDDLPTVALNRGERRVTFLPEPERRGRSHTIISVDDHLVEPPWTFEGRMPARFRSRAPRVVDLDGGGQAWSFDGRLVPNIGLNAVVGRPIEEYSAEPSRFDEMRRGAYDIKARLADMDIDGVYASLCFPSHLAGFGGGRIQTLTDDRELGFAAVQAWNDWHLEEWVGESGGRMIPCQITWLLDPELGAEEVRRNAARGFKALTFPEAPDELGLPSIYTDHWDPIWCACEETGTVVCVHVGSGGSLPTTKSEAPPDVIAVMFGVYAMNTTIDWVYSRLALRFPELRIVQSEGGIGWVAGLLDRLDHSHRMRELFDTWPKDAPSPSEVLQRNFWFCLLDDPSSMSQRHRIGVDHIMVEVDYPHADSTWPDSQAHFDAHFRGLPTDDVDRIAWRNAAELFRHPVPAAFAADPNAY